MEQQKIKMVVQLVEILGHCEKGVFFFLVA
jgi:hypothetical protein